MELDEIKKMDIADFLSKHGHQPVRETGSKYQYNSPIRTGGDSNASFYLYKDTNRYVDFGVHLKGQKGGSGDIIDLVQEMPDIPANNFKEALEYLSNGRYQKFEVKRVENVKPKGFKISRVGNISSYKLNDYLLNERKISQNIIDKYLVQVNYENENSKGFGAGMKSDDGGYNLRSAYGKVAVNTFGLTSIQKGYSKVSVFEGFMDFLSFADMQNDKFKSDIIILNGTGNGQLGIELIKKNNYSFVDTYFDLETKASSLKLTDIYRNELNIEGFNDKRPMYKGSNDLNEFWQAKKSNVSYGRRR